MRKIFLSDYRIMVNLPFINKQGNREDIIVLKAIMNLFLNIRFKKYLKCERDNKRMGWIIKYE